MPQRNRYEKHLRVLKWEAATLEQREAAAYEDLMAEHLASGRMFPPDLHALARQEAEAPITPVRPFVGLALRSVVVLIRSIPLIVGALVVFFLFRACF